MVRASDSGSGDPGSILGRVGVFVSFAQHPAAVIRNNNKTFISFKSKENIHKKEVGPYHALGY